MAALPLIVFDVNETLLDLATMEPIFERIFGALRRCANSMRSIRISEGLAVPPAREPASD